MKKLLLSLLLLLSAGMIHNVFAASPVTATSLDFGKFDATSKKDRIIIARDILKKINAFDNLVANPTPDEMKWINTEREETKHIMASARFSNLIDSPEFQKYKLKEYLKEMKESLIGIINSTNASKEMYWWSCVSYLLIDPRTINNAIPVLRSNNKIPDNVDSNNTFIFVSGGIGYSDSYHMWGEGIVRYILMPYLLNEKLNHP